MTGDGKVNILCVGAVISYPVNFGIRQRGNAFLPLVPNELNQAAEKFWQLYLLAYIKNGMFNLCFNVFML